MQANTTRPEGAILPSLEERVHWATSGETPIGTIDAMQMLHDHPPVGSEPELDLMDWGFAYGVAYALAMLDADRFEPAEGPAIRARAAAGWAYAQTHDYEPVDDIVGATD